MSNIPKKIKDKLSELHKEITNIKRAYEQEKALELEFNYITTSSGDKIKLESEDIQDMLWKHKCELEEELKRLEYDIKFRMNNYITTIDDLKAILNSKKSFRLIYPINILGNKEIPHYWSRLMAASIFHIEQYHLFIYKGRMEGWPLLKDLLKQYNNGDWIICE